VIARRVSALALLVAVIVLVVIVVDSGGSSYMVYMNLPDADGLRQGSPVAIGGQDVGTISMKVKDGRVVVAMSLNGGVGPVGRNASASVASVNLLGQKRIELYKGNVHDPAPSGYTLPASEVSVTTDLDQVIDVLTPDVRARLAILINEAGQAFTGRRADFSTVLQQLPPDLHAGYQLLGGIAQDNHTLADLVRTSDGFVSQVASQRAQLIRTVQVLGQASATVEVKRAQLADTLARAPGTLATLRTFLGKLQATTVPLGPAARDITATAPQISATLAQLDPFRKAADPTLQEATRVAPELTKLATGATPVVRQATPVVSSLATFSRALQPISAILNGSVDNLVAILQNWSRAIQFRDGLSHVFRGEATMTPQILESMINQLQQAGVLGSLRKAASKLTPAAGSKGGRGSLGSTIGAVLGGASSPSTSSAGGAGSTAGPGSASLSAAGSSPASGTGSAPGSGTPSTPGSSGTGSSGTAGSGGGLGSLLSYLLKP
jgi:phospholipid/cholesterol/gamma-HCH transport system substrate-binding protein